MHADTDADTSMDTAESDAELPTEHTFADLDLDEFEAIVAETDVEFPDGNTEELGDLMDDITRQHERLNGCKDGALATCAALNDEIIAARANENERKAEALEIVKEAAFGVYLRVARGDQELFGDRDGRYDDYFDDI